MLSKPAEMHIPDGFLSVSVSIALWIVALVFIAISLRKVNQTLGERQVPLMGVLAACRENAIHTTVRPKVLSDAQVHRCVDSAPGPHIVHFVCERRSEL